MWLMALLGCLLGCAGGTSVSGGGGNGLDKVEGWAVVGPGGRTFLSVTGYNTGPIQWRLEPSDLGIFVEGPQNLTVATPPPATYLTGTFHAGPVPGTCEFTATATQQGKVLHSSTSLRVVEGIFTVPAEQEATMSPRTGRQFSFQVVDPDYTGKVAQNLAWSVVGDLADGSISPHGGNGVLVVAPSRPGTFTIEGQSVAAPKVKARIRITVSPS